MSDYLYLPWHYSCPVVVLTIFISKIDGIRVDAVPRSRWRPSSVTWTIIRLRLLDVLISRMRGFLCTITANEAAPVEIPTEIPATLKASRTDWSASMSAILGRCPVHPAGTRDVKCRPDEPACSTATSSFLCRFLVTCYIPDGGRLQGGIQENASIGWMDEPQHYPLSRSGLKKGILSGLGIICVVS